MIATYHSLAFHNQMKSTPWTAEELFDFDLPESTDDDSAETPLQVEGDRDQVLNHLRHLTVSSLSSYQEIASATTNPHLKSFAEVIVRQRTAQQQALYDLVGYLAANDDDESGEGLSALRSLWRGAIWNLEQGHHGLFLEYAERAEAILEESYLLAAQALAGDPFAPEIRNYAVMICGARAIIEELADSAHRHRAQPFENVESRDRGEVSQRGAVANHGKKSRVTEHAPELDPKRSMTPSTSREGKRRDWSNERVSRSSVLKSSRLETRPAKVGRR